MNNSAYMGGTNSERLEGLWLNPNTVYNYKQIEHSIEEIEN